MARTRSIVVEIGKFLLVFLILVVRNKATKCKMIQGYFKVKKVNFRGIYSGPKFQVPRLCAYSPGNLRGLMI